MAFGGGVVGREMQTFGFYCRGELVSGICVNCVVGGLGPWNLEGG